MTDTNNAAQPADVLVDYEVYQEDELVASSNSLAHAEHYAEQYRQDGPVELRTSISIPGFHAVESALLSKLRAPVAGEAQQRVAYTDSCGHLHWTNGRKILTSLYAAPQASEAVRDAVEICPECDIAGCRHILLRALSAQPGAQKVCNCATCRPHSVEMRMILCEVCGDKRCPHAADHHNECVGTGGQRKGGSDAD